jgi:SSS family solute:Na+ symporter
MAFMGVSLGLFARVAYEQGLFAEMGIMPGTAIDAELGLPLLLSNILPVGLMGLMMAAYFSAIMSTADSCLMAASGNFITDILGFFRKDEEGNLIGQSQIITLIIGAIAIGLATVMQSVLDMMLYSYAFMVSGLLIPVIGTLVCKKPSPLAALTAMIIGGCTTLFLIIAEVGLPLGLDANFYGISFSAIAFTIVHQINK